MSRPSLELRPGQHLILTPQLQQSLRLLQLSTLDLELEISQVLADNPLLERRDEPALSELERGQIDAAQNTTAQDDTVAFGREALAQGSGGDGEDTDRETPHEAETEDTLREHLLGQLTLTRAAPRDVALAGLLIDELDENGYLSSPLETIAQWLPAELEVEVDELRTALSLLQSFDPPGIGARDMSDCLRLQLREPEVLRFPEAALPVVIRCARDICANYLPVLATGNFTKLCAATGCDDITVRTAHALILRLDPRPGRNWTVPVADFAVPDVIVRPSPQGWQVVLNHAVVPRLQVNALYAQMLHNQKASAHVGLQAQLQQAKWVIRNVEQRFETILRVAQRIVARQRAFFSEGLTAMHPLVLKDIADELGMHESTISRATAQKYMLTPFGTLELKRFFGSGVATETGGVASATAVQSRIQKMITEENPAKPLSDSQIMTQLAAQGIVIARRTVAKYREMLRIAPAALRKARAAAR